jgi:ribosomal-protein-alanine N-acetyltransferase
MNAKDLECVLAIEAESFSSPWNRTLFQQEFDLSFSRHMVMTRPTDEGEEKIIGYIVFWIIHDEVQLQRIAVKKDARRQGIGGRLLEEMIKLCRGEGVQRGSLEVRSGNHAALTLYRRRGFEMVGTRKGYYTDTREDALVMCFDIT